MIVEHDVDSRVRTATTISARRLLVRETLLSLESRFDCLQNSVSSWAGEILVNSILAFCVFKLKENGVM